MDRVLIQCMCRSPCCEELCHLVLQVVAEIDESLDTRHLSLLRQGVFLLQNCHDGVEQLGKIITPLGGVDAGYQTYSLDHPA